MVSVPKLSQVRFINVQMSAQDPKLLLSFSSWWKKLAFLEGGSAHERSGSYSGHSNWVPKFLHGSFLPLSYSTALTGYADHYLKPRSFHQGQVEPNQCFDTAAETMG